RAFSREPLPGRGVSPRCHAFPPPDRPRLLFPPSGSAWAASPWCRAEAGKRCLRVRMSKGGAVTQRRRAPVEPCRKVLGADFELANALEGAGVPQGQSVWEAARRLLDELPGFPRTRRWGGTSIEWGRRFLAGNGGSAYVDSDHLEVNLPEH